MKDCFTTLEQSANLIKLGLDPNTADGYRELRDPEFAKVQYCANFEDFLRQSGLNHDEVSPCWSGIKLIEQFPVCIGAFCDYWLEVRKNFAGYIIEERKPGRNYIYIEGEGETLIEKLVSVAHQLVACEWWNPKDISQF